MEEVAQVLYLLAVAPERLFTILVAVVAVVEQVLLTPQVVLAMVLATPELLYLAVLALLGHHPQSMVLEGVMAVLGGQMVALVGLQAVAVQPGVLEVRQAQPLLVTQTLLGKALALG